MGTTITDQLAALAAVEPQTPAIIAATRTLEAVRDHTNAVVNLGGLRKGVTEEAAAAYLKARDTSAARIVACTFGLDPRTEDERKADEKAADDARAVPAQAVEPVDARPVAAPKDEAPPQ